MKTVIPLETYTVASSDIISFAGTNNEYFFLRINSRTTKITVVGDTLEWYNPVANNTIEDNYIITLSLGDVENMSIIDQQCSLEVVAIHPFVLYFHFEGKNCPPDHLEDNLTTILTEDLNDINADVPPKNWNDYNCDYQNWLHFKVLAEQGVICSSDIPDEPKIEEYTETTGVNPCSPGNPPGWWTWKH